MFSRIASRNVCELLQYLLYLLLCRVLRVVGATKQSV